MSLNIADITEEISTAGFSVHRDAHIGALVDSIIDKNYNVYSEDGLSLFRAAVFQNDVSEEIPREGALLTSTSLSLTLSNHLCQNRPSYFAECSAELD